MAYVCLHWSLGVPNWTSLGSTILGGSIMAYVCVHLSIGVSNWASLGFATLGAS
jgi:hypothetical protein